ncbi:MAG: DUF5011 domain-containing protein [Firmicutes bacterium]|nr:DUF5011 domain-containing protein [Bacillota bacterium]
MNSAVGFLKSKAGIATIIVLAVLLVAGGAAFGGYELWLYCQPKFHDLTVELGTDSVSIADFMTEYAKSEKSAFVTDVSNIDLNNVGDTELTLAHGSREETVTLSVVDTTAPTVEFIDELTKYIDYTPDASDFVLSVEDFSATEISFMEEPGDAADYADMTLTVLVTDACGNVTSHECTLHYGWMVESLVVELGETITKADVLLDPDVGNELIDDGDIDAVNGGGTGEYTIESTLGGKTEVCTVTIADTTAPELELQEVHIYSNETAVLDDFVVSVSDASGEVELRLMTELPIGEIGTYTVTIEAEDSSGNVTSKDTVFEVMADDVAPVISGLSDISVYEHAGAPDYLSGVSARDNVDGECEVTYDASGVDLDTVGTYYVIYYAEDVDGNVAEEKRRVIVMKDEEAPVFSGLTDMTKYKGTSAPDYTSGVTATDNVDGSVSFTYDASSVNMKAVGTYYITYTATDEAGNVATATRKLVITDDDEAPVLSGTFSDITLEKHSSAPDYLSGISATDNIDGKVTVTVDDSAVDYDTAGTYYVTYTASDTAGNTATKKRKVTINHDQEDTDALVASIAESLSDDPLEIKEYVMTIKYSYDWYDGDGEDTVWLGFTTKKGNCYVHALCLKAIFDYKGIENQLIWVTDETHYWLIVKVDGNWYHIDATPAGRHQTYPGLMNDTQREATLSGRTWDKTAWPACTTTAD